MTVRSSALPMSNSTCAIAPIVLRPGRNPFCLFVIQMAAVLKMMYLTKTFSKALQRLDVCAIGLWSLQSSGWSIFGIGVMCDARH